MKIDSPGVPEDETEPVDLQLQPVNAEKSALEAYLQAQEDRSHREIYEELLEKSRTPDQRKKLTKKPAFDITEVTWGMVDDEAIYAEQAEEEILRTDLLRMLPKLTPKHLSKIETFEKQQRKMNMLIVVRDN